MTEPIKLTEEDIDIIHDKDNDNDCRVRFTSLEGYEIIWTAEQATNLKQQILENQKKAEKLDEYTSCCQHSDDEYCIWNHELHIVEQENKALKKKLANKNIKHLYKKDLDNLKDYREKFLENKKIIEKIKRHLILYENSADPVIIILKEILGEDN